MVVTKAANNWIWVVTGLQSGEEALSYGRGIPESVGRAGGCPALQLRRAG
jgi:hypothetical protein